MNSLGELVFFVNYIMVEVFSSRVEISRKEYLAKSIISNEVHQRVER